MLSIDSKTINKLREQIMNIFNKSKERISNIVNNVFKKKETISDVEELNNILKNIVGTILQTKDKSIIQSLIIAKGAGITATTGVFGLASLVGTASTGTAIGTLSGGAFTNASLAWIGGSIASGTIVLVGGAVVSGYLTVKLFNGKIREPKDLKEYEIGIINACNLIIKSLNENIDKQNNNISILQMKTLVDNILQPLRLKIYENADKISKNLNPNYKIDWTNNRIKLSKQIDNIKSEIKKYQIEYNKIIDEVCVNYNYIDIDDWGGDRINIITCTIKNDENYYYELIQRFEYTNIADDLIEKMKDKGVIDTKYWLIKDMNDYNKYHFTLFFLIRKIIGNVS